MGGNWFFIAVGVIILLGLYEYGNMVRNRGYGMPKLSGYLSGLLIISAAIFPDFVAFGVFFLIILLHALSIIFSRATYDEKKNPKCYKIREDSGTNN